MQRSGLRTRLTLTYTIALVAGLVLFAALSDVLIDRMFKIGVDQSLREAARGLVAITDAGPKGIAVDVQGRRPLAQVLGTKLDGAIVGTGGRAIVTNVASLPPGLLALSNPHERSITLATLNPTGKSGEAIRVAVAPIERNGKTFGYAFTWRSAETLEDIDRPATTAFAIAIPVIVMLAAIFGGIIARRGLAPLAAMADIASDIEANDLSRRLNAPPTDDELGRLCATFDRMLDRLAAAFERQRRFTADASHELRAPLSVIRAEADLALRKPRDGPEYRRALEAIAAESERLRTLIGDLLAVARADERVASEAVQVDVAESTLAAARRLTPVAETRSVALNVDVTDSCIVIGDRDALARVPVVLLDNAVKFAPSGGHVDVKVANENGSVVIRVHDDGPGFSQDGLRQATQRFWRDDSARGRSGTGLGLAIARTIVEQAGGTIALSNRASGGAEVTVRFPGGAVLKTATVLKGPTPVGPS